MTRQQFRAALVKLIKEAEKDTKYNTDALSLACFLEDCLDSIRWIAVENGNRNGQ